MKIDRLISIIMVLLDKKRISAQSLADMFEVSLRTIYRDIDAIDLAGIPIRSISGVGGGFEIMPKYKVDNKVFSTTDLSTILMGLSSLSGMIQTDELIHTLTKVKSFIPAEKAKDIEIKTNQIRIDQSPWMGNSSIQPHLEIIKTALQERKLLAFTYIGHHGKITVRKAEPYQLVLKNSRWYWQGYCLERNDFRLFRLSRTLDLHILEEVYAPRRNQKPQLDITDMLTAMQIDVELRIHASILDRILDYCTYEACTMDGPQHYIVHFPFIENEYYYDILLGFGDKCECLKPLHIRQELKNRLYKIAVMYDS